MKLWKLALLVGALVFVTHLAFASEQVLVGEVDRVVDGDTFDVTVHLDMGSWVMVVPGVRIRLDCVNTPEKWTDDGKALIPIVREWIEGRKVAIRVKGDGGFSRVLASVKPFGWSLSLEARLYHMQQIEVPLYTGGQTTQSRIEACRRRLEAELP